MLYNPKTKPVQSVVQVEPRKITGRDLAHTRRTAVERALLAADLAAGRAVLLEPTLKQAVELTNASLSYANAAVKLDAGERRSVANGWRPLIPQNGQRALPKPGPSLAELWDRASPAEREAVVRPRVAAVWNTIERRHRLKFLGVVRTNAAAPIFPHQGELNMSQRMEAEILFLDPNDVGPGSAVLIERGFDVEVLDWVDPYGPTVWIIARIASELDQNQFLDWVFGLVKPLNGDVVEAGLSDPQQAA